MVNNTKAQVKAFQAFDYDILRTKRTTDFTKYFLIHLVSKRIIELFR